jgi:cytoskeleton protein RodZ
MTIGERLEEARKRKGISIREVSEATKIRSDYLMSMEDNSMEIPLPEIYKRGFLKNYAKYLKIDPDKILTDYIAQQKGRSALHRERGSANEDREVFGRMELEDEPAAAGPPRAATKDSRRGAQGQEDGDEVRRSNPTHHAPLLTDNTLYLKIAAGLMAVVLVVFLVFVIVNLLRGEAEPTGAETPARQSATESPPAPSTDPGAARATAPSPTITLRASDSVTVIVDDTLTRERIFSGQLNAGDVQLLEREGRVLLRFSKGSALAIELGDGTTVRPTTPGMGQTYID